MAQTRVQVREQPSDQEIDHRIRGIHRALVKAYGPIPQRPSRDPTEELILTILSQNTSDHNSGLAFDRLRERFPTWESVRDGDESQIAEAIRPGGLAQIKAGRIQDILRAITVERGNLDLHFLSQMGLDDALAWLESFKGVGPKTAACVLLFALGRPTMPVDTHVLRVSRRLGLLPVNASADQAHRLLRQVVSPELIYELHLLLVLHGRRVCRPSLPRCFACAVCVWCQFPHKTPPPPQA